MPALLSHASVPRRERVEQAIVQANALAGRADPLELELVMQVGEGPAVAQGELVIVPSGVARLELRDVGGDLVERYLRHGDHVLAARNGELVAEPRLFLPPLFVLQAGDLETLHSALNSFAVESEPVGLVQCGDEDCLILGDPNQQILPQPPAPLAAMEHYEQVKAETQAALELERAEAGLPVGEMEAGLGAGGLSFEGDSHGETPADESSLMHEGVGPYSDVVGHYTDGPAPSPMGPAPPEGALDGGAADPEDQLMLEPVAEAALFAPPPTASSLWVTRQGYQIRGLATKSGGRVHLGPLAAFDGVLVPSWILIEEPSQSPVRIEVRSAARVEIPVEGFGPQWLLEMPPAIP